MLVEIDAKVFGSACDIIAVDGSGEGGPEPEPGQDSARHGGTARAARQEHRGDPGERLGDGAAPGHLPDEHCVADGLMAGNPMGAVGRPRSAPLSPKPLRGEETPEALLAAVASGATVPRTRPRPVRIITGETRTAARPDRTSRAA